MTEVLDLAAAIDRDTVKLPEGKTYELRNHQEFGLVEDHRLRTLLKQIDEFKAGAASAEDAAAASQMLRDLATMLVVDLQEEIPDWACVAIFEFWIAKAPKGENPADPPKKPRQRTTAASSRGSKRSTAATKKRGSTSRRGR